MGSGSSSTRIRSADITEYNRTRACEKSSEKANEVFTIKSDVQDTTQEQGLAPTEDGTILKPTSLKEALKKISELQNQLHVTSQQMTELECQNLDLQDHIQSLEQQIEFNEKEHSKQDIQENYTETLKLKQQCIEKLEAEVTALNSEKSKMRIKFKKKVRLMKTKFAESRNEESLDAYEIKEEVKKLKEENVKLKEKQKDGSQRKIPHETNEDSEGLDVGKTKIILDLSSRVYQQDAKITELENKLTEKEKHLHRMEKQLSRQSESVKDNACEMKQQKVTQSQNENEEKFMSPITVEPDNVSWYTNMTFKQLATSNNGSKNKEISDIRDTSQNEENDLKSIAEEIKQLQIKKKKGKVQKSKPKKSFGETEKNSTGVDTDDRYPSSVSRDSGFSLHCDNLQQNGALTASLKRRQGSAGSRISVLSNDSFISDDSDQDQLIKDSKGGEYGGDKLDLLRNEVESQRSTPVDPANIRQISALGVKAKHKKIQIKSTQSETTGKPPVYTISSRNPDLSEADLLIDNIDEDLLKYATKNITPTFTTVSS